MLIFVLLAVFVAIVGVIVGTYLFINRDRLAAAAALNARLHGEEAPAETVSGILKDERASQIPFLDRLLQNRGVTEIVRAQLTSAGSTQKPSIFLLSAAVSAVAGLAIAARIHGPLSVLFIIAGFAAPWFWLRSRRHRRLAAFDEKFPDTLDMMANAMRAGYSFQAAARFVGDELPAPIGPEFVRFHEEQRLGIDVRTALLSMQERIDSLNLKMFVTAVLIQRETGGNLTELLGNLASLMRDRVVVQGQIDTLTAEPKLSARILTALPVLLFFALGVANPTFMDPFSSSTIGKILLGTAALSIIVGYIFLMKIADIDI